MRAAFALADAQSAIMSEVSSRYGSALRAVFLVGSRARGDSLSGSDTNLLVLTEDTNAASYLFVHGELVTLSVKSLESLLVELFAPEGQQVLDWWLLAGEIEHAVTWLDQVNVLPVARRIISERLPRVELHSRILWDDQVAVLAHWYECLSEAAPLTPEYLIAAAHFLRRAETALRIHHGKVLDSRDLTLLPRPKSFASDWETVWCLGAVPKQVDLGIVLSAVSQIVKGTWRTSQLTLTGAMTRQQMSARQSLLDRVPGPEGEALQIPREVEITPELMDRMISLLWAVRKHEQHRRPALLLSQVDQLWKLLSDAGLLRVPEVVDLISLARIPQDASHARMLAAALRLKQSLENIGQGLIMVSQPRKRRFH